MAPSSAFVLAPVRPARHLHPCSRSALCPSALPRRAHSVRLAPAACLRAPPRPAGVPEHPDDNPDYSSTSLPTGQSSEATAIGGDAATPPFTPGNGGSGGGGGSRGGGGGGDGDGSNEGEADDAASREAALNSALRESSHTPADLPADVAGAYRAGRIPLYAVRNYLAARANPISRVLLPIGPMRDRFLADRLFLLKIAIEEGIGLFGKLSAEYQQRRGDFWRQGEYVLANLVTALLADFALVFFPAPSISLAAPRAAAAASGGALARLAALQKTLPSNVFQTDRAFTLGQRTAGFFLKFSQLFSAGLACCFTGVVLTNSLVAVREALDPHYKPLTKKHNPLKMSAAYALFLGASSGTRYQFINGIESHIFPRLFHAAPRVVEEAATFALRYGNTFWGSQQWVIFCRLLKLEKVKKEATSEASE